MQFAPRRYLVTIALSRSRAFKEGKREGGEELMGGWCRLTLDCGVGLPYLYSSLILSYHFALRQVNRLPAYRKPSERLLGQSGLFTWGPPTTITLLTVSHHRVFKQTTCFLHVRTFFSSKKILFHLFIHPSLTHTHARAVQHSSFVQTGNIIQD